MKIQFLRMKFHNIRDFADLEIPFHHKGAELDPYRVSLVQMPNGLGKTTTMNLLWAAMCGSEMEPERVIDFKPTEFSAEEGWFELSMTIEGKLYTVRTELDYVDGIVSYKTSSPALVGGGMQSGHNLPHEVSEVITESFAHLFIFDGELSEKLLDPEKTEAESAIRALYFLDRLANLEPRIEELINAKRAKAEESPAHSDQGLKNLETRLASMKSTRTKLKAELKKREKDCKRDRAAFTAADRLYESLLSKSQGTQTKHAELKTQISGKLHEIQDNSKAILQRLRRPSNFSKEMRQALSELAGQMVSLKLPKTTSSEFFEELADTKECICGTAIDEQLRTAIKNNAKKYLTEDEISVMNAIKHSIRHMGEFEGVNDLVSKVPTLRAELRGFEQQTTSLGSKAEKTIRDKLAGLTKKKTVLDRAINEEERIIKNLTEEDTKFHTDHSLTWKTNLPLCEREIANFNKKIGEATKTVQFEKKAMVLRSIIEQVVKLSVDLMKDVIVKKSNERIRGILRNDSVQIERIDQCIYVKGKRRVSAGQTLAVSYSFLATLFEDSPHRVPFVIDSPAGSLDIQVRRDVAEIIPKLFDQLIVFILSSERQGFVDEIEKLKDVEYCTVYRAPGNLKKTHADMDKKTFMAFQSEGE